MECKLFRRPLLWIGAISVNRQICGVLLCCSHRLKKLATNDATTPIGGVNTVQCVPLDTAALCLFSRKNTLATPFNLTTTLLVLCGRA